MIINQPNIIEINPNQINNQGNNGNNGNNGNQNNNVPDYTQFINLVNQLSNEGRVALREVAYMVFSQSIQDTPERREQILATVGNQEREDVRHLFELLDQHFENDVDGQFQDLVSELLGQQEGGRKRKGTRRANRRRSSRKSRDCAIRKTRKGRKNRTRK